MMRSPPLMMPLLPILPLMMMLNTPPQMAQNSFGISMISFPPTSLMMPGSQPVLMESEMNLAQSFYAPHIMTMFLAELPKVAVPPLLKAGPWPIQNSLIGKDRITLTGKHSALPSVKMPS
jgi:hypothetical protein